MRVSLVLIGNLKGTSGRHPCPATQNGTVLFTNGRADADLDEKIWQDMLDRLVFPYGVFYRQSDEEPAEPWPRHKETRSVLTSGGKEATTGSTEEKKESGKAGKPAAAPCLSFAEATKPGVYGTGILTPAALKKAIKNGLISGTVVDGSTVYRLDELRELAKQAK